MKQKPLELDLSNIERIAERHGVTPKLALDIFNDIHDVAKVLNNDDQFLPSYSNKKVVELGDFTTIHVGQVATNDTNGGRSHELRIRVFQKDTPMSEHTVILPMPNSQSHFVESKEPYTKEQVIQLMDMLGKFYKPDLTDYPNVKWHTWGGMASDQLNETSEQLLDRLSPNFTLKSQP